MCGCFQVAKIPCLVSFEGRELCVQSNSYFRETDSTDKNTLPSLFLSAGTLISASERGSDVVTILSQP